MQYFLSLTFRPARTSHPRHSWIQLYLSSLLVYRLQLLSHRQILGKYPAIQTNLPQISAPSYTHAYVQRWFAETSLGTRHHGPLKILNFLHTRQLSWTTGGAQWWTLPRIVASHARSTLNTPWSNEIRSWCMLCISFDECRLPDSFHDTVAACQAMSDVSRESSHSHLSFNESPLSKSAKSIWAAAVESRVLTVRLDFWIESFLWPRARSGWILWRTRRRKSATRFLMLRRRTSRILLGKG